MDWAEIQSSKGFLCSPPGPMGAVKQPISASASPGYQSLVRGMLQEDSRYKKYGERGHISSKYTPKQSQIRTFVCVCTLLHHTHFQDHLICIQQPAGGGAKSGRRPGNNQELLFTCLQVGTEKITVVGDNLGLLAVQTEFAAASQVHRCLN